MARAASPTSAEPAPDAPPPAAGERVDGRRLRAERTREAIADALLALLEEGDLRPTAGRVAERAGISERLIYHHYEDMESLLELVASRQIARLRARLAPLPTDGPVPDRVRALVAQRAELHEWTAPIRRASTVHEPFSPRLHEIRHGVNTEMRAQVAEVFAEELAAQPVGTRREVVAAVDAALAWPAWEHLRHDAGLSVPAARRALQRTVDGLLAPLA